MPYAERVAPRGSMTAKSTSLPMPVAAFHNGEERRIPSLQSYVRKECVEYFADEDTGRVGLRCTFCNDLAPEEREEIYNKQQSPSVFLRGLVSVHPAVLTLQYGHMPYCSEVPESVMEHMEALKEKDLLAPPKKRYRWADVADEMGFTDTDAGVAFIPPEISYGRKRQALSSSPMMGAGSGRGSMSPPNNGPADAVVTQLRADWTDADDMKLWEGQQELGNRWKEISEQVFNLTFRGDQVRNRWYSSAFKDFAEKKFGRGAHGRAQTQGKQSNGPGGQGGGGAGSQPAAGWSSDDDMRLWESQQELGNKWKDMSVQLKRTAEHVKTRWYSDKFKDFVLKEFGKGAYQLAHEKGKQERSGARPQVDWTEEDDAHLWEARKELGNRWEDISRRKFGSRLSENHVKNRWYSAAFKRFVALSYGHDAYQNAKIGRRGAQPQVDWTVEDDALLWISHVDLGNRWKEISDGRFMGRISENQVKNRWYSAPFKKYVATEFGPEAHRNAKHRRRMSAASVASGSGED